MSQQSRGVGAVRGTSTRWLDNLYQSASVTDPLARAAVARVGTGSLEDALEALLDSTASEVTARTAEIDRELAGLDGDLDTLRQAQRAEIVDFLNNAQPGPLSELARQVLRENPDVLDELDWKMTDLNSALLAALADR